MQPLSNQLNACDSFEALSNLFKDAQILKINGHEFVKVQNYEGNVSLPDIQAKFNGLRAELALILPPEYLQDFANWKKMSLKEMPQNEIAFQVNEIGQKTMSPELTAEEANKTQATTPKDTHEAELKKYEILRSSLFEVIQLNDQANIDILKKQFFDHSLTSKEAKKEIEELLDYNLFENRFNGLMEVILKDDNRQNFSRIFGFLIKSPYLTVDHMQQILKTIKSNQKDFMRNEFLVKTYQVILLKSMKLAANYNPGDSLESLNKLYQFFNNNYQEVRLRAGYEIRRLLNKERAYKFY